MVRELMLCFAVLQTLVNEELKQYFRPEFLNRLDEIIVFRQLSKAEVKEIADIMLKEVCACSRCICQLYWLCKQVLAANDATWCMTRVADMTAC